MGQPSSKHKKSLSEGVPSSKPSHKPTMSMSTNTTHIPNNNHTLTMTITKTTTSKQQPLDVDMDVGTDLDVITNDDDNEDVRDRVEKTFQHLTRLDGRIEVTLDKDEEATTGGVERDESGRLLITQNIILTTIDHTSTFSSMDGETSVMAVSKLSPTTTTGQSNLTSAFDPSVLWNEKVLSKLEQSWMMNIRNKLMDVPPKDRTCPQNYICFDRFMYHFMRIHVLKQNVSQGNTQPYMKVKLVVTDTPGTSFKHRLIKKGTSKILNLVIRDPKKNIGVYHTGLLIGPYKLDYYKDGLVHVKQASSLSSQNVIFVLDIGLVKGSGNIKTALDITTAHCCAYNGEYNYSAKVCI